MERREAIAHLSEIAREQAGYVAARQAKRVGVTSKDLVRLVDMQELRRVRPGIYALPGAFPGAREPLIAAWLRLEGERLPWEEADPIGIASHTTAAVLYAIGTFVDDIPTFTVQRRRHAPRDATLRLYAAFVDVVDWEWKGLPESMLIPTTTPARTIVDLAYSGEERAHVIDALEDAVAARITTAAEVRGALARRRVRGGRGSARWLEQAIPGG